MSTTQVRSSTQTGRSTGNVITQHTIFPAFLATLALTPLVEDEKYFIGNATLNPVPVPSPSGGQTMTINVTNTNLLIGDKARFTFLANSAGTLVVTFGTSFASAGTLTAQASKYASIEFIYDGTNYVEQSRAITA